MFIKKFALFLILASTLVISSFAGYFTGLSYADKTIKSNFDTSPVSVAAETLEIEETPSKVLIGPTTEIVKKHKYVKGLEFVKEFKEKPSSEILGMDMVSAKEHYNSKGYTVIEFTSDKVIVSKDIDSWPPECYIVKGENNTITIYRSDTEGNLTKIQDAEATLDILPTQDREEVLKGKIYETMEEVETLLEEYSS
jgi:hypothetical protein